MKKIIGIELQNIYESLPLNRQLQFLRKHKFKGIGKALAKGNKLIMKKQDIKLEINFHKKIVKCLEC